MKWERENTIYYLNNSNSVCFFHLLYWLQLIVARITDANIKFESHYGNIDTIHWTLVANSSPTMPAMMLSNTCTCVYMWIKNCKGNDKYTQVLVYSRKWRNYTPICRWSIMARKFQKNGLEHDWHTSDSTHSHTSFRIAFISQSTNTESSPADNNCCVEFAKANAATLLLKLSYGQRFSFGFFF